MSSDDKKSTLIDLAVARKNIPGGDTGVRQMASILDTECKRLMGELHESQQEGDAPKFQRAAHTLKSAATIFGVALVAEVARDLEASGKAGELADVGERVAKLEALVAELRKELAPLADQSG